MMLKAMAVVGSVLLLSGAWGCEEPAVTDDEPNGVVIGMAGSGGFAGTTAGTGAVAGNGGVGGVVAGTGGASGAAGIGGEGGVVAGIGGAAGTVAGMGGIGGEGGAAGGVGGAAGALAGMGGIGGEGGVAGGMGGTAGDDGPPGPCPAGWTCEDTSWTGAVDEAGKPITGTSCGKGGLVPCDACPELTKAICATVFDVQSCTQLCTP